MSPADEQRERLAATFNSASGLYHQARPEYPEALFDRLVKTTGVRKGDHVLEIGCATGKATLPLTRRGFAVTCLEPGPDLAAVARVNLAGAQARVLGARFEDWAPDRPYDMVVAATAWHWVDPAVRYQRASAALRPGGWLAFWAATHVVPMGGDPFFAEIQAAYEEIGEGRPAGSEPPQPGHLPDQRDDIERSGLFAVVDVAQYDWETRYDADGYINLLNTFSGHIAMLDWQRAHLYGVVRRLLQGRGDGVVRRHWGAVLHVARRLSYPMGVPGTEAP